MIVLSHRAETRMCRCGHPRVAHEHYRGGRECALGEATHCDRFHPAAAQPVPDGSAATELPRSA